MIRVVFGIYTSCHLRQKRKGRNVVWILVWGRASAWVRIEAVLGSITTSGGAINQETPIISAGYHG